MPGRCLRERCTIQQDSTNPDDNSGPTYSGQAFATDVACDVKTISGDETYHGRQLQAGLTHIAHMRYRSGILTTMRLLITTGIYKDKVLDIVSVRPIQERGSPPMLELYCKWNDQ